MLDKIFRSKIKKKNTFRPNLECLQERICPATKTTVWTGTTSTAWNLAANWSNGIPDSDDIVLLDNVAKQPVISGAKEIQDLWSDAGANLTINGTLVVNGDIEWLHNETISGTGALKIEGDANIWDGELNVEDVYVYDSGVLEFDSEEVDVGSSDIYVGTDGTNGSVGTLRIKEDVLLGSSTVIHVKEDGLLYVQGGSVESGGFYIDNEGIVYVNGADPDGDGDVQMSIPFQNNGGTFDITVDIDFIDAIDAIPSVENITGTFEIDTSVDLVASDKFVIDGGTFTTKFGGAATDLDLTANVYLDGGDFKFAGGASVLNLHAVNVTSFTQNGGTLYASIDGTVSNSSSEIIASGATDINGGKLNLSTLGGNLIIGNTWKIIQGNTHEGKYDLPDVTWAIENTPKRQVELANALQLKAIKLLIGKAWEDDDGDGIQDGGEGGISGVGVTLYDQYQTQIDTTTTDVNGEYSFEIDTVDYYYVQWDYEETGTLLTMSPYNQGSDDTVDSDGYSYDYEDDHHIKPYTDDIYAYYVGSYLENVDVGFIVDTLDATVSGTIWYDDDEDGIQDDSSGGVSDVYITLYDEFDNEIDNTNPDSNGDYSFTGLAAGNYYIVIEYDYFVLSSPNQGTDDELDSDFTESSTYIADVVFALGIDEDLDFDAGLVDE